MLVKVGSPEAPETAAVRRYLAESLGDLAVVRAPRWLWLPLLHGVILPLRGPKSAEPVQARVDEGRLAADLARIRRAQRLVPGSARLALVVAPAQIA